MAGLNKYAEDCLSRYGWVKLNFRMNDAALCVADTYAFQFRQCDFVFDILRDRINSHHAADILDRFNLGTIDRVARHAFNIAAIYFQEVNIQVLEIRKR